MSLFAFLSVLALVLSLIYTDFGLFDVVVYIVDDDDDVIIIIILQ